MLFLYLENTFSEQIDQKKGSCIYIFTVYLVHREGHYHYGYLSISKLFGLILKTCPTSGLCFLLLTFKAASILDGKCLLDWVNTLGPNSHTSTECTGTSLWSLEITHSSNQLVPTVYSLRKSKPRIMSLIKF